MADSVVDKGAAQEEEPVAEPVTEPVAEPVSGQSMVDGTGDGDALSEGKCEQESDNGKTGDDPMAESAHSDLPQSPGDCTPSPVRPVVSNGVEPVLAPALPDVPLVPSPESIDHQDTSDAPLLSGEKRPSSALARQSKRVLLNTPFKSPIASQLSQSPKTDTPQSVPQTPSTPRPTPSSSRNKTPFSKPFKTPLLKPGQAKQPIALLTPKQQLLQASQDLRDLQLSIAQVDKLKTVQELTRKWQHACKSALEVLRDLAKYDDAGFMRLDMVANACRIDLHDLGLVYNPDSDTLEEC
ncbi:hypothetical protein HDV03_004801 [Kappamyces sp. JEL0829]|nr:hypothetical protein HDV03_004801 [Kappamyces sp. JEL0829]